MEEKHWWKRECIDSLSAEKVEDIDKDMMWRLLKMSDLKSETEALICAAH